MKDDEEIYDDHRHQTFLNVYTESYSCVKELIKEVECVTKIINKDLVIQSLTSLCSKANGTIQTYYSDFTDKDLSILEEGKMFYSCLLSFNKETCILIKNKDGEERKIMIPHCHLLIFDQSVVHTGGSYAKMYHHLFFKLEYLENQFPFNSRGEFMLTINCKHYGKSFRTKNQRNYHPWGCPKNSKGNENRETGTRREGKNQVRT